MMRRFAPLLLVLTACSPEVRFEGTVTVDGVESANPARLHIALSTDPGVPPADPATVEDTRNPVVDLVEGSTLTWSMMMGGSSAVLSAWLWYDTDGDGVREPDEPEGKFTGIVGHDRGIFGGNTTQLPEMLLVAVVPPAERHPDDVER